MDKILAFRGLILPLLGLALLASCRAGAQVAKETPLLTRALPDVPGREVLIERSSSLRARSFRHIDITQTPPWPSTMKWTFA